MKLEIHEVANLFPPMKEADFKELAADIRENGQQDLILITPDNKIIDGVHRYKALSGMEVKPKCKVVYLSDEELLKLVLSKNMHRRHLTASQRAMVAAEIADMRQGTRTDLAPNEAKSQRDAAEQTRSSRTSVQRAVKVKEKGEQELVEAVKDGRVEVGTAAQALDLDPEDQRAVAKSDNPKAEVKKRRRKKKAEAAADDSTTKHTANAAPADDVAHDEADVGEDEDTAVAKFLPALDGVEVDIAAIAVIKKYGMGQVFEVMKTYGDKEQGENTPWNAPVLKLKTEIKSLKQELDEALANLNKAEQSTTAPDSTLHEFKTVLLEEASIDWRTKSDELFEQRITQRQYVDGKRPDGL
jgi:ParB-like chromosome segregation protein Spo0J